MRPKDFEAVVKQERLILSATELIVGLMTVENVSRADLAKRMKVSRPTITQLLSGERNLTLRTLADIGHALGVEFEIRTLP